MAMPECLNPTTTSNQNSGECYGDESLGHFCNQVKTKYSSLKYGGFVSDSSKSVKYAEKIEFTRSLEDQKVTSVPTTVTYACALNLSNQPVDWYFGSKQIKVRKRLPALLALFYCIESIVVNHGKL